MLFNSVEYFLFFFIVIISYYILPSRFRWIILLIASYIFYLAWNTNLIVLILISTLTDYIAGIKIEKGNHKKLFLSLSILVNLGLLWTFKYLDFSILNINYLLKPLIGYQIPLVELILPMGISFYTFQTLAYTIDVYNGKIKAEKHLGYFALYVTFFPQLVAGPIERAGHLLHQLKQNFKLNSDNLKVGSTIIIWGLFKKVVIADRLALFVDPVFNNPSEHNSLVLIIAIIFFAFQIYCDFSAYSDIAIGSAKILGINLMKNFNSPYFSLSLTEFWKRWHISLSTWFRDYVYIPLGGNRTLKWRTYYNLLLTFLISGFWHGANWTFILWGAIHGMAVVMERIFSKYERLKLPNLLKWCISFSIVLISWVFFRANSVSDVWIIFNNINDLNFSNSYESISAVGINKFDFILSPLVIFLLLLVEFFSSKRSEEYVFQSLNYFKKALVLILVFFCILIFGIEDSNQFIYFQF
ncbi:MBOAT family O-acyltransferase [Marivirga arenosa]|uniref:MBOAT family O-acyltransferase n=1 Tax=Marivirga arenosa TaxID=3059076 RepID=A0AA51N7R0_9BACT|nr:MBOAT family O-acyltransferase [Marivirga sp. ABR2-2]WMN07697.1 MBOAT family O-acyltransferase [Marivirga sp. ABR2-2]